jgi:hypothetical protein
MKASYCSSDLSGTVVGNKVRFAFKSTAEILPGNYLADLVVSEDGKRMAGRAGIGDSISTELWFAWLPVKDDDYWLTAPAGNFKQYDQRIQLRLSAGQSNDPQFDPSTSYDFSFNDINGITGDLGVFYLSELTLSNSGIEAGPVPSTVPELPVSLTIAVTQGTFTHVTARLENGHSLELDPIPDRPSGL